MKIELEWTASYEGVITIQGHSYKVVALPEREITPIGDAPILEHQFSFASVLMSVLAPFALGAMQAEGVTDDYVDPSGEQDNTFYPIPKYVAQAAFDKLSVYEE